MLAVKLFEIRSIGLVVSLKRIEMGRVHSKMGVASKICVCFTRNHNYNRNPLQEILDPPLHPSTGISSYTTVVPLAAIHRNH